MRRRKVKYSDNEKLDTTTTYQFEPTISLTTNWTLDEKRGARAHGHSHDEDDEDINVRSVIITG